jgi:YfiH family protein
VTDRYDWIAPQWPAPARVKSVITTRNGGVSRGRFASLNLGLRSGDDCECVIENRARVQRLLPDEPKWLRQVHGTTVVRADGLAEIPEADAAIARRSGTVCAVMIADCLPVLFCDEAASVVGVAHAGWRGLSSGVLESTLAAMSVTPERVLAYLGPAIGPAVYEVGGDVRDAFLNRSPAAASAFTARSNGKWLADLHLLARQRLAAAGVTRIYANDACTASEPNRFFSYRRDGVTGRMAALAWLE